MARFMRINIAALLTILLFLAGPAPGQARAKEALPVAEPQPAAEKIAAPLRNLLEGEEDVEALVQMTVQVDTCRVAEAALRNRLFSDTRPDRLIAGAAVVEALRRNAAESQQDIRRYLEQKREIGTLQELKSFYIVNMLYIKAAPAVIRELAERPDVGAIYPNRQLRLSPVAMDPAGFTSMEGPPWNISRIGAPAAWAQGIGGTGIVVGILDTGVHREHEALKTRWRGYNEAAPETPDPIFNWFDAVNGSPLPEDLPQRPHGTHVTGTILGATGSCSVGAAPGAKWIAAAAFSVKGEDVVANDNDIIAAAQYLLAPTDAQGVPHPEMAPQIINNSWGGEAKPDEWFREMVQSWRSAGILPIFAAGNAGPGAGTVSNPAHYPECLAVGALDSSNALAGFSSRGPGPYDGYKPDISAPGASICSCVPGGYGTWSGTSMAAPHIAGAAALLLQANPHLSVAGIEQLLKDTAQPLTDGSYPASPNQGYGYGLVDVAKGLPLPSGDINGDGAVNVGDAIMLLRSIVGLLTLTPRQVAAADVCADGKIDVGDAITILRYIVGLVHEIPVNPSIQERSLKAGIPMDRDPFEPLECTFVAPRKIL